MHKEDFSYYCDPNCSWYETLTIFGEFHWGQKISSRQTSKLPEWLPVILAWLQNKPVWSSQKQMDKEARSKKRKRLRKVIAHISIIFFSYTKWDILLGSCWRHKALTKETTKAKVGQTRFRKKLRHQRLI